MTAAAGRRAGDDLTLEHDIVDDDDQERTQTAGRVAKGPWQPRRRELDPLVTELLKAHREEGKRLCDAIESGFDRMHLDLGTMHIDLGAVPSAVSSGMNKAVGAVLIVCVIAMVLVTSVVVGSVALKMPGVTMTTSGQTVAAPAGAP